MILTSSSTDHLWLLIVGAHFAVQAFRLGGNYGAASVIAATFAVLTIIFWISRKRRHATR